MLKEAVKPNPLSKQKNGELFPVRRFEFNFAYSPLPIMNFSRSATRFE
jgi:hypothetical protein